MLDIESTASVVVAVGLGATLLCSGFSKAVAMRELVVAVAAVLPALPARLLSRGFVALEIMTGLMILQTGSLQTSGAVGSIAVGSCIAAVSMAAIARGVEVQCACFGSSIRRTLGVLNLAFGALIVGAGVWVLAAKEPLVGAGPQMLLGLGVACAWLATALVLQLRDLRYQRIHLALGSLKSVED